MPPHPRHAGCLLLKWGRTCTKRLHRAGRGPQTLHARVLELAQGQGAVLAPPTGAAPKAQSCTRLPEVTQVKSIGELGLNPGLLLPEQDSSRSPGLVHPYGVAEWGAPWLSGPEVFMVPGRA